MSDGASAEIIAILQYILAVLERIEEQLAKGDG